MWIVLYSYEMTSEEEPFAFCKSSDWISFTYDRIQDTFAWHLCVQFFKLQYFKKMNAHLIHFKNMNAFRSIVRKKF